MNWKLFFARRIYTDKEKGKSVSKPAVRIAMAGIAIGLAVMIVSIAVVIGFKHQVRDKVVWLGADILITNLKNTQSYPSEPVVVGDSITNALYAYPDVNHIQRYSTKPGMVSASDNFQGIVLKGIAQEYNLDFLKQHLTEGEIPYFSDSVSSNKVLVSRTIADKLLLNVGDKVDTYFLEDHVRARRFTIAGIYQTNMTAYDNLFFITDIYTVNRLNNWGKDMADGVELWLSDYGTLDKVTDVIRMDMDKVTDRNGQSYYVRSIEEVYPQIFDWLSLLDMNVWVILCLMTGVAGFTMISGLLIIILERINMIGTLKVLGANNTEIREIFLSFSVFLIGKGMLWGNVIGLTFCALQYFFGIIELNPESYYVDKVPIEFNWLLWGVLNVCTFLVSMTMLIGPSYLISRIYPAVSLRFE